MRDNAIDANLPAAFPRLGLGLGLRNCHFSHILANWPKVDWFEAISENFMDSGGHPRRVLDAIAERYPVVLHGVSMSIGSHTALDFTYLKKLKALADAINARWVSDHLCWTGILGINTHDLLPLPLNEAVLQHVAERVRIVQDVLQRPLVLENPSTYLRFAQSTLDEPAFLRELAAQTGCRLLLDVNNVYVSCFNAGTDPLDTLRAFPMESVVQLHLAGHQHCGSHIIDTHDRAVSDDVWELFSHAWQATGGAATLLEWDGNIPAFEECHAEVLRAQHYMASQRAAAHRMPGAAQSSARHGADQNGNASADTQALPSTPLDFMLPAVHTEHLHSLTGEQCEA